MEVLAGILELQFLTNLLWFAVSIPLFLTLGVVTLVGVRRAHRAATASGDGSVPETSRFGPRAMQATYAVMGLSCLAGFGIAWAAAVADTGTASTAVVVVTMVLVLADDIASAVLVWTLAALARDVYSARRVAGRSAVLAYITVSAGCSATLGLAVLAGLYSGLVPR